MTETENFGEHMMIDGYGGNPENLNNRDLVWQCLSQLPEQLGMKKLAEPQIYWAEGNDKKDPGGWTGMVVIEESHISIHTFPDSGFLSADVYTCKNGMDRKFISDYFKKTFELKDTEENFIKRGTRYPIKK